MGAQKGQAFLPGYDPRRPECSGNTLDGTWNQGKNESEVKVSPKAMVCHTKRELKGIIDEDYYEIRQYENVQQVLQKNKPILMIVTERFDYSAKEVDDEKVNNFKNTQPVTFKYNRLGGLLSQSGELPQPQKDNPCGMCLESLSKKQDSVDGQSENCGGCESSFDPTNIPSGAFRIQQTGSGKDEKGGKGKTEETN